MPKNSIQKRLYSSATVSYVSGVSGTASGGNADTVDGFHASATATINTLLPLNSSGKYPAAVLPSDVAYTDAANTWSVAQVMTLTTPTIADFTNAQHLHTSAASGGAIALPTAADPTSSIGLSVVNGSAGTFMRSDAAPSLSQAIAPTWSQSHTFNAGATIAAGQSLLFGSDVALARKSANVLQLGSGDSFQSPNYNTGYAGWNIGADDTAEFNNVRVRGEFHASTFSVNEIHATGGSLLVLPAYLVFEDVTSV